MNFLFAAVVNPFTDPMLRMRSAIPALKERMILLFAILVIALVVLGWSVIFAKSRRRAERRAERQKRRRAFNRNAPVVERPPVESGKRRRRKHRPRNPTLAETGGLPPIRTGDQPPS